MKLAAESLVYQVVKRSLIAKRKAQPKIRLKDRPSWSADTSKRIYG